MKNFLEFMILPLEIGVFFIFLYWIERDFNRLKYEFSKHSLLINEKISSLKEEINKLNNIVYRRDENINFHINHLRTRVDEVSDMYTSREHLSNKTTQGDDHE